MAELYAYNHLFLLKCVYCLIKQWNVSGEKPKQIQDMKNDVQMKLNALKRLYKGKSLKNK